MLAALDLESVDELYAAVPERLRLQRALDLPPALPAEADLARHVGAILGANLRIPLERCFRGAGCWPHLVPEICREIAERAEFRTAYWGNQYSDHGKYQAFFEYASLMGELLELDAVSLPTYDWGNAAGVALRMAGRITGRGEVVLAGAVGAERTAIVRGYCAGALDVILTPADARTGTLDLAALEAAVGPRTAAVYFESPSFLGVVETAAAEACALAHAHGALAVVGADPISLGVLAPPAAYGADLVCGDLQPLGVGMHFGGGLGGFIASPDEERFVAEYPTYLIGYTTTDHEHEHAFGFVAWERTSYIRREHGKDFGGTTTTNCAIAAATYLALHGPQGMRELAEGILQRTRYAGERLGALPGVVAPALTGVPFKELVVDVAGTGLSAAEINRGLLERGFLGGYDLAADGQPGRMLVCVTEAHAQADIDALADALAAVTAAR